MATAFLWVLLLPSLTWGETLYVRPVADCPTNGDGSAYACAASGGAPGAWSKFSSMLFSTTDETAGRIDPGDYVYVCGSFLAADKQDSSFLDAASMGANTSIITYDGDCSASGGTANAMLDGEGSVATGLYTAQRTHFTFKNMTVKNITSRGVSLYSNSVSDVTIDKQITLDAVTIRDVRGASAICIDSRGKNITIQNSTIANCGTDGLWHDGENLLVDNTAFSDISVDAANNGDGIQLSGTLNGAVIQDSTIDMTAVDSKYCIISQPSDTGVMRVDQVRCVRRTTDTIGSGMRIECPTSMRCSVLSSTITGGDLGLHLVNNGGDLLALGNLIIGNTHECMSSGGTGAGTTIMAHNTCDGFLRDGILQSNPNVTATIQGNIVRGGLDCIDKQSGNAERYNLVYGCANAVANSNTPTAIGAGDLTSDPLFLSSSNWKLALASPARGAAMPSGYCVDVRGRSCPSATPHIGAYQSTSGDLAATRATRN